MRHAGLATASLLVADEYEIPIPSAGISVTGISVTGISVTGVDAQLCAGPRGEGERASLCMCASRGEPSATSQARAHGGAGLMHRERLPRASAEKPDAELPEGIGRQ